ncbi:MAG: hypothetical protein JXD21_03055 [Candidatus Omnitrophica bacterium]|nr:hypothetical protein [Candidatus Omnitrophota bacterium]
MMVVFKTWRDTWRIIRKQPVVFLPFIISGAVSLLVLYILFLAPQRPIAYLLAPPIRAIAGEKFLHYPFNFVLLPNLFRLGDLAVSAFLGMLMSAVSVGMVADVYSRRTPSFLISLIVGFKRYFALVLLWIISFGIIAVVMKFLPHLFNLQARLGKSAFVAVSLCVSIVVQSLFVYMLPILIIDRKKLWGAFLENIRMLLSRLVPTVILVALPSLLYVPMLILKSYASLFARTGFPESVLIILAVGVIAALVIDYWITISITVYFLKNKTE